MYGNDSGNGIMMMMLLVLLGLFIYTYYARRNKKGQISATAAAEKAKNDQMSQDIKATKTSRVVDQVEILDDLGATQQGYRQYCELIGNSMSSGGVIAPYSGREVAYYDVKCYRLETVGGRSIETLVAHETSIEPFYFTDDSCDTPVYIDLKSFGDNVILVNSTNHVEGPNSDFSNAFRKNSGSAASSGNSGSSPAMAAVEKALEYGSNLIAGAKARLPKLAPGLAFMPAPAYAFAGVNGSVWGDTQGEDQPTHVKFAGAKFGGRPGMNINIGFGGGLPPHMRDFMMGGSSVFGMPYVHRRRTAGANLGDVLVGMTLSSLLRSLNGSTQSRPVTMPTNTAPTNTFQGFRIVEDVVPLNSPTYCIGEIYRNGDQVYMGRSLATDYTTSFFACRPEAEVLSALG